MYHGIQSTSIQIVQIGGSRDMAGEILKLGAMIVDALREYEHPVYIYLPLHGEL